tara:strand:+ start:71 stop:1375 length:1305 start_codon:yes stop_codon:yes gene_type:complete
MNVCVIGLGKIGLPLAVQIASKGHRVFGVDISTETVDKVTQGVEPFPGEENLSEMLTHVVNEQLLLATTDISIAVKQSDYILVVVPLVVDENGIPDFFNLDSVTNDIANYLCAGSVVIYETTLPIGTTRERFAPKLSEVSKLEAGKDFFVVHSPERVFSGRIFADLQKYPKLVGGINSKSTEKGVKFYKSFLDFVPREDLAKENGVWAMSSADAAEFAKIAETTFRNVNIALANEFSKFSQENGMDIFEVIEASNSNVFSHIHNPGIAVGGHCIPIYPKFYLQNHPEAILPFEAIKVNESMPSFAIKSILDVMNDIAGRKVVIFGASYRGGVKEAAFSGVIPLVEILNDLRAEVYVHDEFFDSHELNQMGYEVYQIGDKCDIAIFQADHKEYLDLLPRDLPGVKLVLDGRGFLSEEKWSNVIFIKLGVAFDKEI